MVLNTSNRFLFVDGAMLTSALTELPQGEPRLDVGGCNPKNPMALDEAIERLAAKRFGSEWPAAKADHEELEDKRDDRLGDDPRTRRFFVIEGTWTLGPDGKRLDPWIDPHREAQHRAEASFTRRALAAEPKYLDMWHGAIGELKRLLAKGRVTAYLPLADGQWWPIPRLFWRNPEARDVLDKGYVSSHDSDGSGCVLHTSDRPLIGDDATSTQKPRRRVGAAGEDDALRAKIVRVLIADKKLRSKHPGLSQNRRRDLLVDQNLGYGKSTIAMIIAGAYAAMIRLNIKPTP